VPQSDTFSIHIYLAYSASARYLSFTKYAFDINILDFIDPGRRYESKISVARLTDQMIASPR
jgi:hypothetical protein